MLVILEILFLTLVSTFAVFLTYLSFHVSAESKTKQRIPLFWEKDYGSSTPLFDKSKIKYRDGDNT